MATSKPRITYVDTLKGLCIILVIFAHSGLLVNNCDNLLILQINDALRTYRMPTYYFLSGIFFKVYNGFNEFARRKVNNIIIPLLFFYIINVVCSIICSYSIAAIKGVPADFPWEYVFDLKLRLEPVAPLWFLISLFWANLFFYVLKRWLKDFAVIIVIALLAILGYFLESHEIKLPLFLNVTFFGLPYYVLGYYIKRFGWLEHKAIRWLGVLQFFVVAVIIVSVARDYTEIHNFTLGSFMIYRFLVPFVSILSLFWLCKCIPNRIPVVTLIGRYSIIALGTHMFIISFFYVIPRSLFGEENEAMWRSCTFVVVIALELVIIPFMRNVFPRFTAQKDFFKPGWKL